MLSGVAPLSVLPPPPQLRESRTKKYFEILWKVSEINSRINFTPPNPCYLISAATILYSCGMGIVWSTWKPLCSNNYNEMSPSLWTLSESVDFWSCRIADPLVCWQKKHREKWLIEDGYCPFLLFPSFLHCTLALCTFTVSVDGILIVSSLIYINVSKQVFKLRTTKHVEYISTSKF